MNRLHQPRDLCGRTGIVAGAAVGRGNAVHPQKPQLVVAEHVLVHVSVCPVDAHRARTLSMWCGTQRPTRSCPRTQG